MSKDVIGREAYPGRALNGDSISDRRTKAVADFMFLMQYRRDLRDARDIVSSVYGATAASRLDPDILQANTALRDAVLELEASR